MKNKQVIIRLVLAVISLVLLTGCSTRQGDRLGKVVREGRIKEAVIVYDPYGKPISQYNDARDIKVDENGTCYFTGEDGKARTIIVGSGMLVIEDMD